MLSSKVRSKVIFNKLMFYCLTKIQAKVIIAISIYFIKEMNSNFGMFFGIMNTSGLLQSK